MSNKQRLGYIDTSRGIAAVSVMIFHFILQIDSDHLYLVGVSNFFKDFFDLGKIAVIIFFIISGLVIPYSLKETGKIKTIKKFVISRFFRLYPVYWLSAIMGFGIFGVYNVSELFINFTMLQQFIGIRNIIGLYWTLQIELIFYFLIALVFVLGKLRSLKFLFSTSIFFLLITVVVAYFRGSYEIKLPLALPLALSLMFFGSFYKRQLIDKEKQVNKFSYWYFIIYFVLIPIICKLGYDVDFGHSENWFKYLITYFSGMIIFLIMATFKPSSRSTEYLGKISYSIYLFHPIFIYIVMNYFQFTWYSDLVIVALSTLIFSHLTFKLVENPSIILGRKVKSRLINSA